MQLSPPDGPQQSVLRVVFSGYLSTRAPIRLVSALLSLGTKLGSQQIRFSRTRPLSLLFSLQKILKKRWTINFYLFFFFVARRSIPIVHGSCLLPEPSGNRLFQWCINIFWNPFLNRKDFILRLQDLYIIFLWLELRSILFKEIQAINPPSLYLFLCIFWLVKIICLLIHRVVALFRSSYIGDYIHYD